MLREERIIGINCYVVESIPNDPEYKYSRMILWVRKDYFVPIKIDIYDREDRLAKQLKVFALKTLGKRKIALKSEMTDLLNNHKTILILKDIEFDATLPKDTFTLENLKNP